MRRSKRRGYVSSKRAVMNFDRFNRDGLTVKTEFQKANVTDVGSVYVIGHSVAPIDTIGTAIAAVLRKLFEMAQIRVQGPDTVIGVVGYEASGGPFSTMRVTLVTLQQATGVLSTAANTLMSTTPTLDSLVSFFYGYFEAWSSGYDNAVLTGNVLNTMVPHAFLLQNNIANTNADLSTFSEILLDEVMLEVQCVLQGRFQNRSLGEGAGGGNSAFSNVVDRQPMEGRIYEFSGIPRPKVVDTKAASGQAFPIISAVNGVRTFGGASLDQGFSTIPSPGYFTNCKNSYKMQIQPGQIKGHTIGFTKRISLTQLMKTMRLQYNNNTTWQCNYSPFPTMMIAMEDVIQTSLSSQLILALDFKRSLGIRAMVHKRRWCKDKYNNNVVP